MRVLITSGGTKVPIDKVRSITNKSNGTFGSQIADSFVLKLSTKEDEIDFLMAKNSKIPNCATDFDFYANINLIEYETFNEYEEELNKLLEKQPDFIIIAAAVSDYKPISVLDGKIRTADNMTIELKPTPKLIHGVREKCQNSCICGFKLLVNSTTDELLEAAHNSIKKNKVDFVVANDLSTIKDRKNHSMWIVEPNKETQYFRKDYNLPDMVRDECLRIWREKYNV